MAGPYFQPIRKECLWAVAIIATLCIITTNYHLNSQKIASCMIYKTATKNDISISQLIINKNENVSICHFPELDPWHPSLAPYVTNDTISVVCPQTQPNLTYIDLQGFLILNQSALEEFLDSTINENETLLYEVHCFYWTFDRAPGLDDNRIAYSSRYELNSNSSPVALDQDMVEVICYKNTTETVYWNIHAHPANKSDRIFDKPTDTQLSILMVGIDSISYSLLYRRMPLTLKYVVDKMGMHVFKKMNKVGLNSYPNLMVMLTGKRANNAQEDMPLELDSYNINQFDSAPLIWRHFAAKGYATVFNEDWSNFGTFHYYAHGFAKKPVDYYYHMFWLNYDKNYKTRYCLANKPTGEVHLDIARRHVIALNDRLQFGFNFFTDYSHQYEDDIGQGDEEYLKFFKDLYEGGYFNKTAILFFGDHGHRFNNIRKTLIGSFEEHNPFFSVWLPEWFYAQHPHLKKILAQNVDRYTSTFDVHETLKDILNEDFDTVEQHPKATRGLSLLRRLPERRNCKQAGVPDNFCLCKEEKTIETNDTLVLNATEIVIMQINELLKPLSSKCRPVELVSILSATNVAFDKQWGQGHDHLNKLRLILLTKPNDAIFEAMLGKSNKNGPTDVWVLVGEIERISEYGKSADCIADKRLRTFCTCL